MTQNNSHDPLNPSNPQNQPMSSYPQRPAGYGQPQQFAQPQQGQPQQFAQPPQGQPQQFAQPGMPPATMQPVNHGPFLPPWWGFAFIAVFALWLLGCFLPNMGGDGETVNAFHVVHGWWSVIVVLLVMIVAILNAVKKVPQVSIPAPLILVTTFTILSLFQIVDLIANPVYFGDYTPDLGAGAIILLLDALAGLGLAITGIILGRKNQPIG